MNVRLRNLGKNPERVKKMETNNIMYKWARSKRVPTVDSIICMAYMAEASRLSHGRVKIQIWKSPSQKLRGERVKKMETNNIMYTVGTLNACSQSTLLYIWHIWPRSAG